ncbi:MAG: 30S ribosomal protein S17 [Gammaproteobacteria bacterium]
MSETNKIARVVSGRVVSSKMDKTATVVLERLVKHPLYGKYIRRSSKVHIHDANNVCQEGDLVSIEQCRPISKTKAWKLVKVIGRAV